MNTFISKMNTLSPYSNEGLRSHQSIKQMKLNNTGSVQVANSKARGLTFFFRFSFRKIRHTIYTKSTNSNVSWSTDGRYFMEIQFKKL